MRNITLRLAVIFLPFLAIVCVVFVIKFYWVSADAPYYLSVARDISDGSVLYKDVHNAYTPFVMLFYSIFYSLMEDPGYFIFLLLNVTFVLVNACLLFILLRKEKVGTGEAQVTVLAFALVVLSSDGNYINLEVYSVFFVLLAMFLLFRNRGYVVAGGLLGCSFLCKQYGVLNFAPFALYVFLLNETLPARLKKISLLGAGGLAVFIGFVGYYTVVGDVPLPDLFRQISGAGYSKYSLEKQRTLLGILAGAKVFVLFLSIPVMYFMQVRTLSAKVTFCLAGILVNLLPVLYQGFQHYYINTYPYLLLAIGFILQQSKEQPFRRLYPIMLVTVATISSIFLVARVFRYRDQFAAQHEMAEAISHHLPPGSPAYIQGGLRYLYVLNNYKNPYLRTIGYDFTFYDVESLMGKDFNGVILSSTSFRGENIVAKEIRTKSASVYLYTPIRKQVLCNGSE